LFQIVIRNIETFGSSFDVARWTWKLGRGHPDPKGRRLRIFQIILRIPDDADRHSWIMPITHSGGWRSGFRLMPITNSGLIPIS